MSKRAKITAKTPETKRENSVPQPKKANSSPFKISPIDHILFLQRTIGNQAMQRLLKEVSGRRSAVGGHVQAKLKIGPPNDIYEQEADRIADQVMRMTENTSVRGQLSGVRKGDESVQRKPTRPVAKNSPCGKEEEEQIQTKALSGQITPLVRHQEEGKEFLQAMGKGISSSEVPQNLETSINVIKGGGQPLPESARNFFEPRFGHNFSGVRVHTDAKASESAQAVRARAYTVGRDVVFAEGQYDPSSEQGRKLLTHELTHVVQQTGGSNNILETVTKSRQEGLFEKEADAASNKVEKADVEMLHRTTTPSIQLQIEKCELERWKPSECTSKITGVADPDKFISRARNLAVSCVSKAISELRAPSVQTILQLSRHFHCPDNSQIVKIRKAFEQIQNHLPRVGVLCYTSPPCKKDTSLCYRYPGNTPSSSKFDIGIEVCPNFFSDVNFGIRTFIVSAGWVPTQFSTFCGESESCYDDFTKSASEMVNNPFSYANFALEALGYSPISEEPFTVPCRPEHTDFNVNVPPDAPKNPRAIRPLSPFETKPPGSRIVPVWRDATGKYFIYYSGLPGGRVYMPGEGERFYLPEGLVKSLL